jgi:hypothetical protein
MGHKNISYLSEQIEISTSQYQPQIKDMCSFSRKFLKSHENLHGSVTNTGNHVVKQIEAEKTSSLLTELHTGFWVLREVFPVKTSAIHVRKTEEKNRVRCNS